MRLISHGNSLTNGKLTMSGGAKCSGRDIFLDFNTDPMKVNKKM